ncbi:MAG: DUF3098 domain-containing protein [Candidatus Marinimicrobia bacterium]|nr:DUF3098 domain-containing protein [Candidatus Neomarinimicrobiota bacterium]
MKEKELKKRKGIIDKISLTKTNYLVFLAGIIIVTIGFFLMATGGTNDPQSLTLSPIILLIGYLIVIPISIFIGSRKDKEEDNK